MAQSALSIVSTHCIHHHWLGIADFNEVRTLQARLVDDLAKGEGEETILTCQHPAVFTLGKRTTEQTRLAVSRLSTELNIPCIDVTRGGEATFHGPGQLMIYPVLDLRRRGLGVRRFVEKFSALVAEFLAELDIAARFSSEEPGLWVDNMERSSKKVASVGLRIDRGITEHGFAVNLANDLDVFSRFSPCGLANGTVTSVFALTGNSFDAEAIERAAQRFYRLLPNEF